MKKQATMRIKNGETLLGKEGILTPLFKELLERALKAHFEGGKEVNRKNGKGKKQMCAKRSETLGVNLNRQIIALYALGASYKNIRDQLSEMYDVEVPPTVIRRITDKILPLIQDDKAVILGAQEPVT